MINDFGLSLEGSGYSLVGLSVTAYGREDPGESQWKPKLVFRPLPNLTNFIILSRVANHSFGDTVRRKLNLLHAN